MATLTNTKIKDTYDGLLKTTDNEALDASGVTLIEDGLGNASALSVGRSGNGVSISGNLAVDTTTLYVDATNNRVAVGTTNAQQKLHVQDAGAVSIRLNDSTTNYWDLTNDSNLIFSRGGTERMRINSTGNIGINEQNPNISGFTKAITLGGADSGYEIANSGVITAIFSGNAQGASISGVGSSGIRFRTSASGATTERMRIDSAGNVGIGTSSPASSTWSRFLQIEGTYAGLVYNSTAGGTPFKFSTGVDDNVYTFRDETNAATRMVIDASGNVGIGTSSLTTIANYTSFNVNGTTGSLLDLYKGGTLSGRIIADTNHGIGMYAVGSEVLKLGTADTERLRIDSSGNVGIGNSVASSFNQRVSAPHLVVGSGSNSAGVTIYSGTTSQGSINFADGTTTTEQYMGGIVYVHGSDNYMAFNTNGASERMRIDSSGNVQIGNTGTAGNLQLKRSADGGVAAAVSVSGDNLELVTGYATGNMILKTASTERMRITSGGAVLIGSGGAEPSASQIGLKIGYASSGTFVNNAKNVTTTTAHINFFNPNGLVGAIKTSASSTIYETSSDYRLKENVVEMTGALDRVDALKPSRFNFIADPETTVDGFLAHEVAEVIPEAITGEKDAVDEEGNPIYQGIDQSKIVPLLVGAIKELKAEIETLKSQLNA